MNSSNLSIKLTLFLIVNTMILSHLTISIKNIPITEMLKSILCFLLQAKHSLNYKEFLNRFLKENGKPLKPVNHPNKNNLVPLAFRFPHCN